MIGFPDLRIRESDLVCPITDRERNHCRRRPKNSPPYRLSFPGAKPTISDTSVPPFSHSGRSPVRERVGGCEVEGGRRGEKKIGEEIEGRSL